MTTTPFSPPRVKPVNRILFYLMTGLFGISLIYALIFFIIGSWSESQIIDVLQIKETGFSKYEMVIDDQTTVPLSRKKLESLVAFEDCDWLPEEQQEFVYEGYAKSFEQYPNRIFLHIWSIDESGSLANLVDLSIILAIVPVVAYFILLCVLIYRNWKTIQPLKQMDCPASLNIPTPGKGVGYLFIPLWSLYWVFSSLSRLVQAGRLLSLRYGISYTGPSTLLVTLFGIVFCWNMLTQKFNFTFLSIGWYIDFFSMPLLLVLWPLLGFRLQRMIQSFSTAQSTYTASEEISQ